MLNGRRSTICAPIDEDCEFDEDSSVLDFPIGNTRELLEEPDRESIANGESWALSRKALGPKFEVAGVLKKRNIKEVADGGFGNQRGAATAAVTAAATGEEGEAAR